MANNRMWLVCRGCGKKILLGKTMLSGYYVHYDDIQTELNNFYGEHAFCDEKEEVYSENQYELAYDTAIDEGIKEI